MSAAVKATSPEPSALGARLRAAPAAADVTPLRGSLPPRAVRCSRPRRRLLLPIALVSAFAVPSLVTVRPARAATLGGCSAGVAPLDTTRFEGLSTTREETLLELLPRRPPARYAWLELAEFERRLNNLGIFDHVDVRCEPGALVVRVREKWTLVPEIEFSSGRTWSDTYALLGATEYNIFGTANQLGLSAYREQRGFGVALGFNEHDYQRHGWSFGSEASISTAALRFDDGSGWRTTSATIELSLRSPPLLHEYFNYVAGVYGSTETTRAARLTTPPPSTQVAQTFMGFSWDGYEWHDLVPRGLQASLWVSTGGLLGGERPMPRHSLDLYARAAVPLSEGAVVMARVDGAVGTRGNANYGILLGSVDGVRGLRDAAYFNWAQVLANVELRQSVRLGQRWALQGVVFCDAAALEQMTSEGGRGDQTGALSLGAGARLVPTWISNLLLRLDASRLLAPELAWFTQLGLEQYF